MQRGDHLVSPRTGYSHHGLYLGNQCVIHYAGISDKLTDGSIMPTSLESFCQGNGYSVIDHPDRIFDREASILRAYSRMGEQQYSLAFNNCEHFVNWCIEGEQASEQIERFAQGVCMGMQIQPAQSLPSMLGSLGGVANFTGAGKTGALLTGLLAPAASPVMTAVAAGLAIGVVGSKVWELCNGGHKL